MSISVFEINWTGVFLATLVYYLLGALWFSPIGFQKKWDRAIGFQRVKGWKPDYRYFLFPLLSSAMVSISMALLQKNLLVESFGQSVCLGLVTGLGFALSISLTNAITPKKKNPILFGLLTGFYHVFGIVTVSAIVYLM